jgi:hypothetical protein
MAFLRTIPLSFLFVAHSGALHIGDYPFPVTWTFHFARLVSDLSVLLFCVTRWIMRIAEHYRSIIVRQYDLARHMPVMNGSPTIAQSKLCLG